MALPVVTYANGIAALQGAAAGTPAAALANAYAADLLAIGGWPGGAPQIQLVNANLAEPKAHFDVGGTIVISRAPASPPVAVLDAILYEANNALNGAVAAAMALPINTAVGTYAAALANAEFMTLKNYVRDLLHVIYGGGGLAALTAPGALAALPAASPNQAVQTLTNWLNVYVPIYTNAGIAVGAIMAANAADAAAALQFTSTPHNPGAIGANAYLATYSTFQVYYYERVKQLNAAQLESNITANYPAGTPVARLYRAEWQRAGLTTTAKIGLYACLVTHLQNAHAGPAAFPAGLPLPVLLDTNTKNDVAAWLNANTIPTVVNAFSKDLVRSLLAALAPRVIDAKWQKRAI